MRVVVAGGQLEKINEARRILLSEGLRCEAEDVVGYDRLPDCLAATRPDVVLVYCNGSENEGLAAIETAHHLVHGPILAVGEPAVSLMRESMRAGAREFLDINNLRQDLSAALVSIENVNQGASKRGRIVTVFSPNGGVGVTTIALNLAVSFARMSPPPSEGTTVLIDATAAPSDLSLLLDMEPKHTLAEVCRQQDRLDRKLLAGAVTAHASGLHVLPQAGYTQELGLPRSEVNSTVIRQMFVNLRKMYEFVVVDLGHTLSDAQIEAMRLSNVVLIAAIADVPGLRRVRWAVDTAEAMGIPRDRFQVVLSRYGGRNQVSKPKIEEALHLPILAAIPDDAALVTNARNEGLPLAEVSSRAAAPFVALAKDVQRKVSGVEA